jgi:hypothetical protein
MNEHSPTKQQSSRKQSRDLDALSALSQLLDQQTIAIGEGNPILMTRLYEALSGVLSDAVEAGYAISEPQAGFSARIESLRGQIALNQRLLTNGMAVSDHFVRSLAGSDALTDNPLFSGVA